MNEVDLDIALLGFLIDEPKHGYDLFKEISNENGFGQVYRIKIGKMYAILKRLESRKLINTKTIREGNRPPKNLHQLTKNGKDVFLKWMHDPIKHGRDFRVLFLLKVFFLEKKVELNVSDLFAAQKKECTNWISRMQRSVNSNEEISLFNWVVNHFRESQIKGYLKWLDWCERSLVNP